MNGRPSPKAPLSVGIAVSFGALFSGDTDASSLKQPSPRGPRTSAAGGSRCGAPLEAAALAVEAMAHVASIEWISGRMAACIGGRRCG